MPETPQSKPSNIERVIAIGSQLKPDTYKMERFVEFIMKYRNLLSNTKLLLVYRKDWIALNLAWRLYNAYKSGARLTPEKIKESLENIRKSDPALAQEIERILPAVPNGHMIFADLIEALGRTNPNDRSYFIAYVSTYVKYLIARANSISDKKLSAQLVGLFLAISGLELGYLIRYRDECDTYASTSAGTNLPIDFFIRLVWDLYLKGGFNVKTQYLGVYRDFKDEQLSDDILKNAAVKNLYRYREQLRYVNLLISLCKAGEESEEWNGFWGKRFWGEAGNGSVGFWGEKGDAKGKNFDKHAELFLTKYGNKDFRDILMAYKYETPANPKGIGENPEGWGGEWKGDRLVKPGFLQMLLAKLQDPSYQWKNIIIPALKELHDIFQHKINELTGRKERAVEELIKVLEQMSGLKLDRQGVVKRFGRLLEKRKWKLAKNAENEINVLLAKAEAPLLAYDSFVQDFREYTAKIDLDYMANRMKRLAAFAANNSRYVAIKMRTDEVLGRVRSLVRMSGAENAKVEALWEIKEMSSYEHISEEELQRIEGLGPRARTIASALAKVINSHIRQELTNKFIIGIYQVDLLPISNYQQIAAQQNTNAKESEQHEPRAA